MPAINIHSNVSRVFCLLIFVLHCSTYFSTSSPVMHSHYLQLKQQNLLLISKSRYSSSDRNYLTYLNECYDDRVTILLFSCCWINLSRLRWLWASTRCSNFRLSLPELCRPPTSQIVLTRTSAVPEHFLNEFGCSPGHCNNIYGSYYIRRRLKLFVHTMGQIIIVALLSRNIVMNSSDQAP